MSTEETNVDSSFESISRTEPVPRRELEIRLQLKELSIVRLRRRMARLEDAHDYEPGGYTSTIRAWEDELLTELDAVTEDDNE